MKVLSVNVGLPRTLSMQKQRVSTGIFKRPVSGVVKVGALNLEGDAQADLEVHGGPDKAVYVYSGDHVQYWKRVLNRDDLGPGTFGENLTVEGLTEEQVAIGDEFGVGTARFLVTQPRLPCFKLALALETPTIVRTFLESGRTGFYLRVLQPGGLQTGDSIVSLPSREVARVTIAEFLEVHRRRHTTRNQIDKILNLGALPASWKDWFAAKVQISE